MHSFATNLVLGDTNAKSDVFVHDRLTGATTLVSVGIGGAVLQLVGAGVLPDVGAPDRPGRDQIRTSPLGVSTCTAMMPGVPWGATHSTLTSSSGASTDSPSHSLTRSGSPAISRQLRE